MSLFDRDDVAPPEECSRCGKLVVRTSLFCPQCGQSRVNPLPKQAPLEPEPPVTEQAESAEHESESEEEQKRSTLSRTTDWIIKNITRVGQGAHSSTDGVESEEYKPVAEESSEPQRAGGRTSSWPERLQQSSRAQTRFVLHATDGRQFTLGEALSGIGSAESAPEGDEMVWISLTAPDNSVDAFHLRCGVEDGLFWIEDVNSIMGTVISEPGRAPLQCIPFERYFVVRGSDLQLGSVVLTLQ
ncbi:MAG: hypothetical protein ACO2ZT_05955 [Pontimonas sp.]